MASENIDNQRYYAEILRFLQNSGETSDDPYFVEKHWVKIHASNYFLKGGDLYYGKRKPRKVILDDDKKTEILNQLHVDPQKGFHHGVKKLHRLLMQEYFWRYSYKSVSDFIQRCPVCRSNNEQNDAAPVKTNEPRHPWTHVDFFLMKSPHPSSDQVLAILHDPASFWLSATALRPSSPTEMALFLLENIVNHGMTAFSTYGLTPEDFAALEQELGKLVEKTDPVVVTEDVLKFGSEEEVDLNANLKNSIQSYFQEHPADWADRATLLSWIWKLRNEVINGTCALEMMSSQRSISTSMVSSKLPAKRKRPTGHFACQVCGETFATSAVLRLHESCHLEERQTRSTRRTTSEVHPSSQIQQQQSNGNAQSAESEGIDSTSVTVATVRALIAQGKPRPSHSKDEPRPKRGEYRRYTQEVREAIVQHALRHGAHEAARSFSSSLGYPVSYSSVRNFVQAHQAFTSQMKEEIGRYATECGVDAAQKHYTAKLNKSISTALIRKFRRMYLRAVPANPIAQRSGLQRKGNGSISRNLFCASVREEIGKYAAEHGVQSAVRHFSDRLQMTVKESTVRKFKKMFAPSSSEDSSMEPTRASGAPPEPPPPPQPPSQQQQNMPESNYFQMQSLPPPPPLQYGHYHHPAPQYVYHHQPINGYHPPPHHHHHNQGVYGMVQQPVPPYPSYSTLPPPPQYQPSAQLPSYPGSVPARHWSDDCPPPEVPSSTLALPTPPPTSHPATADVYHSSRPVESEAQPRSADQHRPAKKKGGRSAASRGSYATYSPHFRLEIGRYAAEYGCQEAAQHFKAKVGHDIPESTVRGLRDRYLAQRSSGESDATGLMDNGPRGRPLRLGRHDAAVQECLRELKRSGERVNAFVAITTARQVLLQKEPSLLSDNGGPVKLTTNWAKAFLKRMGINKQQAAEATGSDEPVASTSQTQS